MKPIRVKIFIESHTAHTTQFFSGLYMLEEQGLVNVSLHAGKFAPYALIRLEVNGSPVFIDLADHSNINMEEYDKCDSYFKRMLLKSDKAAYSKLHPYGLNYPVYYKGDKTITRSFYSKNRKHISNSVLRANALLARLFKMDLGHHTAQVHHFEHPPMFSKDPVAIFSARLWKPEKVKSEEKKHQRLLMNEQRIAIVREARKKLGNRFIGGIDINDYAKEIATDTLIDSPDFSKKQTYLQLLKNSSIGIANAGLEDSIGFKFAEYVCMSKAIVTSPIDKYLLPGDFADQKNYLTFNNTAGNCIEKCEELLQNENLRNAMMQNNYSYYQQYLHPANLVKNILETVTKG